MTQVLLKNMDETVEKIKELEKVFSDANQQLESGTTWLHPDYWGTGINTECKYLMLKFCFEKLRTIRVQIKSVSDNVRSCKAIEKVGFKFEGVLRNDKILVNGTFRMAAYYSLIEGEWEKVKLNLEQLLMNTK